MTLVGTYGTWRLAAVVDSLGDPMVQIGRDGGRGRPLNLLCPRAARELAALIVRAADVAEGLPENDRKAA